MKIIADAAIPCIRHYFAGFGDLELLDGRDIDAGPGRGYPNRPHHYPGGWRIAGRQPGKVRGNRDQRC